MFPLNEVLITMIKIKWSCLVAGVSSSNPHREYGKRVGGSSFFKDSLSGKEHQALKVLQL